MSKNYTSKNQSEILIKLGIPFDTADMWYGVTYHKIGREDDDFDESIEYTELSKYPDIKETAYTKKGKPAWSLAALSEFILPYIADDDGNNYKFYLSKDGLDRWVAYYKSDDVSIHICEESDNMIDVILEMVCWLKKEEYI